MLSFKHNMSEYSVPPSQRTFTTARNRLDVGSVKLGLGTLVGAIFSFFSSSFCASWASRRTFTTARKRLDVGSVKLGLVTL